MQSGKCLDLDDKNMSGYCLDIRFFIFVRMQTKSRRNRNRAGNRANSLRRRKLFVPLFKALKHTQEEGIKKESCDQLSLEKETEPSEWILTLSSEQTITYPFFVLVLMKYFF